MISRIGNIPTNEHCHKALILRALIGADTALKKKDGLGPSGLGILVESWLAKK